MSTRKRFGLYIILAAAIAGGVHWGVNRYDQTNTDTVEAVMPEELRKAYTAATSQPGEEIVWGDREMGEFFKSQTIRATRWLKGHVEGVLSVVVSDDGSHIVTGSHDGTVRVWDSRSGKQISEFRGHDGGVLAVAITADGKRIASGGGDGRIVVWNADRGDVAAVLEGHTPKMYMSLGFCPDGRLVSASSDGTIRQWDVDHERALAASDQLPGNVVSAAFSADRTWAILGTNAGNVVKWDLRKMKTIWLAAEPLPAKAEARYIVTVAISADGSTIYTVGFRTPIHVWNASTGEMEAELTGTDFAQVIAPHPDGKHLLIYDQWGMLVWDASTHVMRRRRRLDDLMLVHSVAIDRKGRFMVIAQGGAMNQYRWDNWQPSEWSDTAV